MAASLKLTSSPRCAAAEEPAAERGDAADLRGVGLRQRRRHAGDVDGARVDAGARPPEAPHGSAGKCLRGQGAAFLARNIYAHTALPHSLCRPPRLCGSCCGLHRTDLNCRPDSIFGSRWTCILSLLYAGALHAPSCFSNSRSIPSQLEFAVLFFSMPHLLASHLSWAVSLWCVYKDHQPRQLANEQ